MPEETRHGWGQIVNFGFAAVLTALFSINTFILTSIRTDVRDTKNSLQLHLTNHEIHIPREQVVTKAEYQAFCNFSDLERKDIQSKLDEIRLDVKGVSKSLDVHMGEYSARKLR